MRGLAIAIALSACTAKIGSTGGGGGGGGGQDQPDAGGGGNGTSDAPPFAKNVGPYFTTQMFFNEDVSATPVSSKSASIISALRAAGGWGNGA